MGSFGILHLVEIHCGNHHVCCEALAAGKTEAEARTIDTKR
jgi:hypothetical protein